MHILQIFTQLKTRKGNKMQHSDFKDLSDYVSMSISANTSLSNVSISTLDSDSTLNVDELEYIFESTHKNRYCEQDVLLSAEQELDLELAKLTGLLERGEKRRMASQDYDPTI
ncbi:hypothetical protein K7432_000863 [Basidiobolus ranarum]|uniref:Uncharacterized protein n=1 Tax=Basidiobolus ranarum TaxID=34480 RepID=A0ABR2WAK2_9FUNG